MNRSWYVWAHCIIFGQYYSLLCFTVLLFLFLCLDQPILAAVKGINTNLPFNFSKAQWVCIHSVNVYFLVFVQCKSTDINTVKLEHDLACTRDFNLFLTPSLLSVYFEPLIFLILFHLLQMSTPVSLMPIPFHVLGSLHIAFLLTKCAVLLPGRRKKARF